LSATLNGVVAPHGLATNYWFDYGTTGAYDHTSSQTSAGSAWGKGQVGAVVGGLQPDTTYHFRVAAQNAAGITYGADEAFTTPNYLPAVTTEAATDVKGHSARLHAKINPKGFGTTYEFQYGTTSGYGQSVPLPPQSIGAGSADVPVENLVAGLTEATVYHFRVVATNSEGTSAGSDRQFRTPGKPVIATTPALYTNTARLLPISSSTA
jgi:hypothetical protein